MAEAHTSPCPRSISPKASLLTLPPEIRHQIYTHLVTTQTIKITPAWTPDNQRPFLSPDDTTNLDSFPDAPTLQITPIPLTSQLLRVSRFLHTEYLPYIYTHPRYDVSARSAPTLLFSSGSTNTNTVAIPPHLTAQITHIVLDWDQLQDFAWSLSKPSSQLSTAGLRVIETAHWRTRVLGGNSLLWRDAKSYERQLVTAALDITRKHSQLRVVAQWGFTRSSRMGVSSGAAAATARTIAAESGSSDCGYMDVATKNKNNYSNNNTTAATTNTYRIKWRFVPTEEDLRVEETKVDLEGDLDLLKASGGGAEDEGSVQMALDPI